MKNSSKPDQSRYIRNFMLVVVEAARWSSFMPHGRRVVLCALELAHGLDEQRQAVRAAASDCSSLAVKSGKMSRALHPAVEAPGRSCTTDCWKQSFRMPWLFSTRARMLSAWRATEMSSSSVLMTFLSSRGMQYTNES